MASRHTEMDTEPIPDDWRSPQRGGILRNLGQGGEPISVTISKAEFDSKFYRVRSGKVLVLNNKEFNVPGVQLGDRAGSDVDASAICQRFSELGFEYDLETDLSKTETIQWFQRAKEEFRSRPVDCFVLVLLSHGTEEGIYATDEHMVMEEIVNHFNATNCATLRFKPKVIIIQSCRGTNLSRGVPVGVDPNQADSRPDLTEYNQMLGLQTICLPNEADFLFAYATVPGSGAFRNAEQGTPFIRHLSEAIQNMEVNEDFCSVLTSVNKTVGMTYRPNIEQQEYNNLVQMPCFISHLTKILRLKPASIIYQQGLP